MNTKSLISSGLPTLSLLDTGDRAMSLMNEYRVFHLPLVDRDNYLALISEDDLLDWDTPEEPLSYAEFINFRPAVVDQMHPFEAIKVVKEFNLSLLPVVNEHNHFVGVVTMEGLFSFMADQKGIKDVGGIFVLEMEERNYSLSEIARICESNDISIISVYIKTVDEFGLQWVTVKTNKTDLQSVLATFERYNYTIVDMFSNDKQQEQDLQQNYNMLMRYINL